jgi:spore coat protein U-like protein
VLSMRAAAAAAVFVSLGAVLLTATSGPARAATASGTLSVSVVVQPSCTVSGATLDFGTYSSGQAGDLTGFTRVNYNNCPAGQLRFELNGGANGTTTTRKLSDGRGGLLNYGIFRDSARTQNFGQGTDAKLVTLSAPGRARSPSTARSPAAKSWRAAPTPTPS